MWAGVVRPLPIHAGGASNGLRRVAYPHPVADSTKPLPLTPGVDTLAYGAKPLNLRDSRAIVPPPTEPMTERRLQAENLHLWRGDRHVLRGVRFCVNSGECLQITGGNGAGKTSLLRALSGLMYPEEGTISWCGGNIRRD